MYTYILGLHSRIKKNSKYSLFKMTGTHKVELKRLSHSIEERFLHAIQKRFSDGIQNRFLHGI